MIHDTACASVILEARLYLNTSFSFDVSVIGSVALLTRGRNKLVCSSFLVSFFQLAANLQNYGTRNQTAVAAKLSSRELLLFACTRQ